MVECLLDQGPGLMAPCRAALSREKAASSDGPAVAGSAGFQAQVRAALSLLKDRAPAAFAVVAAHIGLIREGERSGMRAYDTPPTFEMSEKTASASTTWAASAIAHDSFHSKLYHDYLDAHPAARFVPVEAWTGKAAETACVAHQVSVLKDVGAPPSEVDWARSQADGNYVKENETWKDYEKRDW